MRTGMSLRLSLNRRAAPIRRWERLRWKARPLFTPRPTTAWRPTLAQKLRAEERRKAIFSCTCSQESVLWKDQWRVRCSFPATLCSWSIIPELFLLLCFPSSNGDISFCVHKTWKKRKEKKIFLIFSGLVYIDDIKRGVDVLPTVVLQYLTVCSFKLFSVRNSRSNSTYCLCLFDVDWWGKIWPMWYLSKLYYKLFV